MIITPVALRTFLAAQTPLTAITGDRLWAAATNPPAGYKPAMGPGIAFNGRGGSLGYENVIVTESTQFKCYAANALATLELYGVLVDVLHDRSGGAVRHAELESTGYVLQEPETGWFFALTYFSILYGSGLGRQ